MHKKLQRIHCVFPTPASDGSPQGAWDDKNSCRLGFLLCTPRSPHPLLSCCLKSALGCSAFLWTTGSQALLIRSQSVFLRRLSSSVGLGKVPSANHFLIPKFWSREHWSNSVSGEKRRLRGKETTVALSTDIYKSNWRNWNKVSQHRSPICP